MASPSLLIKPLLKAIGKQLTKLGITAKVGEIEAINILRTTVDKNMITTVAKKLGLSSKQLREITKGINLTEARKKAVKGKEYIKNLNRFLDKPEKTIKDYVNKQLKKSIKDGLKDKAQEKAKQSDNVIVYNALKLLQGKLKKVDVRLDLSQNIWDNIDKIDIEDVFTAMEYLETDFYYTSNFESDNPVFLDIEHKGYKQGMEQIEFIEMIESMILNGHHSIKIDGIY